MLETVQETAELMGLKELPKQVFNIVNNHNTVNVFDQLLGALLAAGPSEVDASALPAVEDVTNVPSGRAAMYVVAPTPPSTAVCDMERCSTSIDPDTAEAVDGCP